MGCELTGHPQVTPKSVFPSYDRPNLPASAGRCGRAALRAPPCRRRPLRNRDPGGTRSGAGVLAAGAHKTPPTTTIRQRCAPADLEVEVELPDGIRVGARHRPVVCNRHARGAGKVYSSKPVTSVPSVTDICSCSGGGLWKESESMVGNRQTCWKELAQTTE